MLTISKTNKFEKDLKRLKKQGFKLEKLERLLEMMVQATEIPAAFKDHKLTQSGSYAGQRAVHVMPDCVMIYERASNQIILKQIGSHTNLFDSNRQIAKR